MALIQVAYRFLVRLIRGAAQIFLCTIKWDAFLNVVPGILLLLTAIRALEDTDSSFFLRIICYQGNTWISKLPSLLALVGIAGIFLGVFRFSIITLETRGNLQFYVVVQCILILTNLTTGVLATLSFDKVANSLEESMLHQMALISQGSQHILSTEEGLSEAWDHLQIKMKCCGVDEYDDYLSLPGANIKHEPLPKSCCVMRHGGEFLSPENLEQCQMDARMRVYESIFIHKNGCADVLTSWIAKMLLVPKTVLLTAGFAQFLATCYACWIHTQMTV